MKEVGHDQSRTLKQRRHGRRDAVDAHKERMIAETRAWRLRELREEFDLTQVELAAELGVSQNRVSRIERGDLDKTQSTPSAATSKPSAGTFTSKSKSATTPSNSPDHAQIWEASGSRER